MRSLFKLLGWTVEIDPVEGADPTSTSRLYGRLRLVGTARLSALLNNVYLLIPASGDAKHYFVGHDEIDKLMARGKGWLGQHSPGSSRCASSPSAIRR